MDKHSTSLIIILILLGYIVYNKYINFKKKIDIIKKSKKIKLVKFINNRLNNKYNKLFIVISPELGDNIIFNGAMRYF